MRGYIITTITMIIVFNLICEYLFAWANNGDALFNLNKLLIINSLLAIFVLRFSKYVKGFTSVLFLGSIPVRMFLFTLIFYMTFSQEKLNLAQWSLTYIFTFLIFHFTETGFIVNQISRDNENT